jgi:hypothetical protein
MKIIPKKRGRSISKYRNKFLCILHNKHFHIAENHDEQIRKLIKLCSITITTPWKDMNYNSQENIKTFSNKDNNFK